MNYPAIKHGDKVSFTKTRPGFFPTDVENGRVDIWESKEFAGRISVHASYEEYRLGYQDNPCLMENGITNFRIHERADGTRVWMKGDTIENGELSAFVAETCGDLFCTADGWNHYKLANDEGWKLKDQEDTVEEECEHELENNIRTSMPPKKKCVKCDTFVEEKDWHKYRQIFKSKGPEQDWEITSIGGKPVENLTLDDIDNCKIVYTKQEIVDVLNHVMNNYTGSSEPAMHLVAVSEKLGINLDEYEK